MAITLTEQTMKYISLFEGVTGTTVKDCIETDDKLVFVVKEGDASKAIGKGGEGANRLRDMLKKNIQIVEFADNAEAFLKNIFRSYGPEKVVVETRGKVIHATITVDPKLKGKAIGKAGSNLRLAREIISRHYNIQSVSVA